VASYCPKLPHSATRCGVACASDGCAALSPCPLGHHRPSVSRAWNFVRRDKAVLRVVQRPRLAVLKREPRLVHPGRRRAEVLTLGDKRDLLDRNGASTAIADGHTERFLASLGLPNDAGIPRYANPDRRQPSRDLLPPTIVATPAAYAANQSIAIGHPPSRQQGTELLGCLR
jgi:hypothetical protein